MFVTISGFQIKLLPFVLLCLGVALVLLLAFAFSHNEPIFFLKWFFGLQADD